MNRLALLPCAVLTVATGADAKPYSDTRLYTQASGDALVLQCDTTDPTLGGIGGVCFTLDGSERRVSLSIDDVSPAAVGGAYEFGDALGFDHGTVLASGSFCDDVSNVVVPVGAVSLVVYVDGPMFGPTDCAPDGAGIGVRGTITASFV